MQLYQSQRPQRRIWRGLWRVRPIATTPACPQDHIPLGEQRPASSTPATRAHEQARCVTE